MPKYTIQYNPLGSTFINDDPHLPKDTLKVVAQKHNKPECKGCYYAKRDIRTCNRHACTPYLRKDKQHVIFVKVKTAFLKKSNYDNN